MVKSTLIRRGETYSPFLRREINKDAGSYRPDSVTSVLRKIMEQILMETDKAHREQRGE